MNKNWTITKIESRSTGSGTRRVAHIRCEHGVDFVTRCTRDGVRATGCPCVSRRYCGRNPTHGESPHNVRTKEYNAWRQLRQRCRSPQHKSFESYGGRGIKVCPRWDSFSAFLEDMGRCPPDHTIDRINNDGDYDPGNCRWAPPIVQQRNKRTSVYLEHGGERLHLKEWAARTGLTYGTLYQRMRKGWSSSEILAVLP